MKQAKCRYCGQTVTVGKKHRCSQMRRANKPERVVNEDDGDFFISLAVAAMYDDWMIGTAAGGNIAGAALGDFLAGDDEQEKDKEQYGSDSGSSGSSYSDDSGGYDSGGYDSGGGSDYSSD